MVCSYPNREEALVSYTYDELNEFEKKAFALHLASCDACRSDATSFVALREQLATWSPPELVGSAVVKSQPAASARWRWTEMPTWMQVAAAVLVLGVSAGAANLRVDVGSHGLSVRTGWMDGSRQAAEGTLPVTQAQLASVQQDLRRTIESIGRQAPALVAPVNVVDDEEIVRRTKALIAASEKRQQAELALRLADLRQDVYIQRQADLVKVQQTLNYIDRSAVARSRLTAESINSINSRLAQTVSQTSR